MEKDERGKIKIIPWSDARVISLKQRNSWLGVCDKTDREKERKTGVEKKRRKRKEKRTERNEKEKRSKKGKDTKKTKRGGKRR